MFDFQLGERGSGFRSKGQVQDFYELRDECLQSGTLFEDPDFPCEDSSIFFSSRPRYRFEWKRPMVSKDLEKYESIKNICKCVSDKRRQYQHIYA